MHVLGVSVPCWEIFTSTTHGPANRCQKRSENSDKRMSTWSVYSFFLFSFFFLIWRGKSLWRIKWFSLFLINCHLNRPKWSEKCFTSILARSGDNTSGKDFCISILRSQGLLQRVSAQQHHAPADDSCANCCSRKCKVCNNSETTLNMLICDNCEDAFHASCCYPRIKKIPIDEWFCYSCLKKKRKLLMV